jgi:hypothetical protein
MCLFSHSVCAADALVRLYRATPEWFPATTGMVVVRSVFESLINARYIAQDPGRRANAYIDYSKVLRKRELDVLRKHRNEGDERWHAWLDLVLSNDFGNCPASVGNGQPPPVARKLPSCRHRLLGASA